VSDDRYPKWDYKEYPKTLPADDLWGQVRRTIYGKPVPEDQIQMIVDAIVTGAMLDTSDVVLDIGCGNGALAARWSAFCNELVGVDASPFLVSVANKRFSSSARAFICAEAGEYVGDEKRPDRFTKAICYATISYLSDADVISLLRVLRERFVNIGKLFIGGIPDSARASTFFGDRRDDLETLGDPKTQIGVWRSRDDIQTLAGATGWRARYHDMRDDFYQAHYRYNAILEPIIK